MASITQEEFNLMLQTAIAQGLPGGYVASKWSWEEIEAKLEMTNKTLINSRTTIPSNSPGWYRIAELTNASAFFNIRHPYNILNGCNILFFCSVAQYFSPSLFVVSSRFDLRNGPFTVDGLRIMQKQSAFFVDFHYSQSTYEHVVCSQSFCAGTPPAAPFAIKKVEDLPKDETKRADILISAGTPNGIIAYQSEVSAAIERGLSL